jgi:hypothetical protein
MIMETDIVVRMAPLLPIQEILIPLIHPVNVPKINHGIVFLPNVWNV